eukprot:6536053-Alexandrium_andersonii.AAC.1
MASSLSDLRMTSPVMPTSADTAFRDLGRRHVERALRGHHPTAYRPALAVLDDQERNQLAPPPTAAAER